MKILSIEDFVSIFQEIDVDDIEVSTCIVRLISRFAEQCTMSGITMEMEVLAFVTLCTPLPTLRW